MKIYKNEEKECGVISGNDIDRVDLNEATLGCVTSELLQDFYGFSFFSSRLKSPLLSTGVLEYS